MLIHELSHKLDMGNSLDADGFPPLSGDMDPQEWHRIFTAVWDDLQARLAHGEATPIDDYAASHPGECFAVSCEYFFTAPRILHEAYPALYGLLSRYFRQDRPPNTATDELQPQRKTLPRPVVRTVSEASANRLQGHEGSGLAIGEPIDIPVALLLTRHARRTDRHASKTDAIGIGTLLIQRLQGLHGTCPSIQ